MKYKDFETILSSERMNRYVQACNGDTRKAMTLYRENLRLSQEMFTLISCFEVALRNAIDNLLSSHIGKDWLRDAILPAGIFATRQFAQTKQIVSNVYHRLSMNHTYSHSKLLSELDFGIWKYMFSNPQYRATGRILLHVFPNRPKSSAAMQYNNTFVFNELDGINKIRNRIAHHEPVCFMMGKNAISTAYILQQYQRVQTLFTWMKVDAHSMLYGLDHVQQVCNRISSLT
jgi:hypothetical protein